MLLTHRHVLLSCSRLCPINSGSKRLTGEPLSCSRSRLGIGHEPCRPIPSVSSVERDCGLETGRGTYYQQQVQHQQQQHTDIPSVFFLFHFLVEFYISHMKSSSSRVTSRHQGTTTCPQSPLPLHQLLYHLLLVLLGGFPQEYGACSPAALSHLVALKNSRCTPMFLDAMPSTLEGS